jgi:drug/metabolite transporter (DMT)-like permease
MLKRKDILAYIASFIYASIFGLSFLFSKKALDITTPFKLISFRFLLAFIVLSLLILFRIIKVNYRGKNLKGLFILSMTQPVIYFIFETYGIKYSSSSYAGLMVALIPIIVTIMGIFLLKEIPSKIQWMFILLSVSGVVYIVLMDSSPGSQNTFLGTVFLLIAVFVGSLYNILSRKSSVHFSSIEITYFMMGAGAIVFNIISFIIDFINGNLENFFQPLLNKDFLISILYLGILSSITAFFLINFALSALPASKAVIFGNLATVISIIAGVVFLREAFYYYHIIGSIIIIFGIIGTNYFNARKVKRLKRENQSS